MMPFDLHPEAARNFDRKGEELLSKAGPHQSNRRLNPSGFQPDFHVAAVIPEEELIGELRITHRIMDQDGEEVGRCFEVGQGLMVLLGQGYEDLIRIAEGVRGNRKIQEAVSYEFLVDTLFSWTQARLSGATRLPMMEYVLGMCSEQTKDFELWFPVAWLNIQSDIKLGRVILKTISRDMLDQWHSQVPQFEDNETNSRIKSAFERERHNLLGFAAATIRLRAEPKRAFERGFEEADRSVSILRFFSPVNFLPNEVCYCDLLGREHLEGLDYLRVEDGKIIEHNSTTLAEGEPSWRLDDKRIGEISGALSTMGGLLESENRTSFQDDVLEALLLHSRSSLAKTYADKLVYVLVALESLLLKDSQEPIQKNLSERMAVLVSKDVDERLRIIRNVSDAYALRSRFIHHGKSITKTDEQSLRMFMANSWRCLYGIVVLNASRYSTKRRFLEAVDRLKLSGGTTP